ncbi:hypothetical protein [uncultured Algoriphagus sp.]|uniref:hypothetical protein n=1 Tax=uncultured Algoriphagus sp. TaxID=417365 RepID=UPI0030ECAD52|tara:strand:- start:461 stop:967 length:507 start_codon:yes stop_codon:yes gene_type:complete
MNLKSGLILVLMVSIGFLVSCKESTKQSESINAEIENPQDSTLFAILEMENTYKSTDSLKMKFTVFNPTTDSLSFTKYHTPFEGFMNNFLTIIDNDGKEIAYQGAMAKRIMPPVKESYIVVAPNSGVSTTIDISKAYALTKSGTYTITYTGGNVSGMDNGKPIQIKLE